MTIPSALLDRIKRTRPNEQCAETKKLQAALGRIPSNQKTPIFLAVVTRNDFPDWRLMYSFVPNFLTYIGKRILPSGIRRSVAYCMLAAHVDFVERLLIQIPTIILLMSIFSTYFNRVWWRVIPLNEDIVYTQWLLFCSSNFETDSVHAVVLIQDLTSHHSNIHS